MVVPKSPLIGFCPRQNDRPDRLATDQLHDMPVRRRAKMRPPAFHLMNRRARRLLDICAQGNRDKPPRMVVERTVIITGMELVQSQRKA